MIIFKYIYRIFIVIFTIGAGYFKKTKTRKPKTEVPTFSQQTFTIDPKIGITAIEIIPVDTKLDLYKSQILVGIRLMGFIDSVAANSRFKGIHQVYFYEKYQTNPFGLSIEIVPVTQTEYISPVQKQLSSIQYTFIEDKAHFNIYLEEIINIQSFGPIEIMWKCGAVTDTMRLFRYK